jgi:hypothetical protein
MLVNKTLRAPVPEGVRPPKFRAPSHKVDRPRGRHCFNRLKLLAIWSEREDLNLRPLVSQTSALTGLRHAPMPFP